MEPIKVFLLGKKSNFASSRMDRGLKKLCKRNRKFIYLFIDVQDNDTMSRTSEQLQQEIKNKEDSLPMVLIVDSVSGHELLTPVKTEDDFQKYYSMIEMARKEYIEEKEKIDKKALEDLKKARSGELSNIETNDEAMQFSKEYCLENFKIAEPIIDIGEVQPCDKSVPVDWKFDGKQSLIEHIRAHCGCTVDFSVNQSSITANFNEEGICGKPLKQEQIDTGRFDFTKKMTVYLLDGQPLKVPNDDGDEVWNNEKAHITLKFKGWINLKGYKLVLEEVKPEDNK